DTIYLCEGQTDTLRIEFDGPGPYTFQYIAGSDTLPPMTTTDTLVLIPVTPGLGFTNYTLLNVFGGNCDGPVSGNYGVFVTTVPTATLIGDTTLCFGESTSLQFLFTGSLPFVTNYTANGVPQPPDTSFFNPRTIQVNPDTTTVYQLTSVSSGGCAGSVSGGATVVVQPELTATISGGGQICQGGTGTTITFTFEGPGPYTFVYRAGATVQPAITTTDNPFILDVNPPVGTVYSLISVTNGICSGTVSGNAVVAVFTPSTASLAGDLTLCESADTTVMVDFTGSGPFTLVYTANNVLQDTVDTFDDPYFIPVDVNVTTTYTLVSVESPGCMGMVTGSATVTINYAPTIIGLDIECDETAGTYIVEFDIQGGTPPYTLLNGNGTFTGDLFTSAPIPLAQGYSIIFHDANDCGDIEVSGMSNCNCTSESGTLDLTPITACVGDTAVAVFNGDQVLDNDDVLLFILHTNPELPLGQILGWSTTPGFSFLPGMQVNTTYYLSAIVGNADPMGLVDLSDPCWSVSQGVSVIFRPAPGATFSANGPFCVGDTASVTINLTGTPPYNLIYSVNGTPQPALTNFPGNSVKLDVPVQGPTTLILESISDVNCTSSYTDTLDMVLGAPPVVSNLTITCDYNTDTYQLEFDAAGTAPFIANGITGIFTGNHFVSTAQPANQPYDFQVSDAGGCGQAQVSGMADCACVTLAGDMNLNLIEGCSATPVTAVHQGNENLAGNDILVFILHDSPGPGLGNILDVQNQPVFSFQPGVLTIGATYYISAVAGNDNGMGQVDLNDPCLSVSPGTPVLWNLTPTATMDANFDICPGGQVFIPVTFSGVPPFSFTYTANGQPNTVLALQNSFTIGATLLTSTNYQAVSVENALCPGIVSGQAAVTVHPTPQITAIDIICAPDNQSYTVEFDIQNADLSNVMVTGSVTGTVDPGTGHFISNPIPAQTGYSAIVTDAWMCGLDSISGGVSCSCLTSAGTMDQAPFVLCPLDTAFASVASGTYLATGDTLLYALVTTPSPVTWNIVAFNGTPEFVFNPAVMLPGTNYYIISIAGNITPAGNLDLTDPCLSFGLGPAVRWQTPASVILGADTEICAGDTTTLAVLFDGNPPFNWVYQINGQDQPGQTSSNAQYLLPVSPASTSLYTLSSATANGCPASVSGGATVTVQATPEIQDVNTVCDFISQTYTLQFSVNNGAAPNPNYNIAGVSGIWTDTVFVSDPIPSGQVYSVTVSTSAGCQDMITGSASCVCVTSAGVLSPAGPLSICLPGVPDIQVSTAANLEPGDSLAYLIYSNPADPLQSILAWGSDPGFAFQAGMQAGVTYYVASIAGNALPGGGLDLGDPCLSRSNGVPVVYRQPPTASLMGDTVVCVGSNVLFKINFSGTAPFQFVYSINGGQQTAISAPQNSFTVASNNIQQDQVFALVSVMDAFCPGTVSGSYNVDIQNGPTAALLSNTTICPGDSVVLSLQLTGGTSYNVTVNGGATPISLQGIQSGATFTVAPGSTTTYSIGSVQAQGNNCPLTIGPGSTVTIAPPVTATAILSDYGGFNISCPGENDGSIILTLSGGIPPVVANWDNGATGSSIQGLEAGVYTVTLVDNLGCMYLDSFVLTAPEGLLVDFAAQDPICFGARNGQVILNGVQGGIGPFAVSVDGATAQVYDVFPAEIPGLAAGTYMLSVSDVNGCETVFDAVLADPPALTLNLGPDTLIYAGDSILLTPVVSSTAIDSILWTPVSGLSAPTALNTFVQPSQTTPYTLWVQDTAGCTAQDMIVISVEKDVRVYVPGAIKPGAGNGNGTLTVFAGPEVSVVRAFRIYDRWGECVFERLDLLPNDQVQGWDGTWKGDAVAPGVYVWVAELEYFDGTTEVKAG
ncbi:MAG: hypothetical protein EP344_19175, partial [Bacteroidetes bacterium]